MMPFMSKTELDISQIGKADLIRYYELPDKTQGLLLLCGAKYINLCEHDAHWSMLVQAADRLYINDPAVFMDTYTRDILESRKTAESVRRFGFLTKDARQNERYVTCGTNMFSERAVVYFLSQIYKDLEVEFVIDSLRGWRGRYIISCKTDGKERQLPCRFTADSDGYRYSFANLFAPAHTADITLRYRCAKMEIVTESCTARDLRREYCFDFSRNILTQRAMSGREIIFHEERALELPAAEMPESVGLVCDTECAGFAGYELPWGEKVYLRCDENSRCRESVFDNGSGLVVQICGEDLHENTASSVYAVHEVFSHDDRMLVQSRLYSDGSKVLDSSREGYYYRYIRGGSAEIIGEDLFGMPAAQILDRYLYR